MSIVETSKYISLILRHKPETIGISLDEHGWANVEELIEGIGKTNDIDMAMLEEIVATDNKQRYSFNEDKTLIRANQGHSIPVSVDVELEVFNPPKYLYHGTAEKYVTGIEEKSLIPKSRLYVHLSSDYDTAANVEKRHKRPIIYRIWTERMVRKGFKFYRSVNGVWLTKEVPLEYLEETTFNPASAIGKETIVNKALQDKCIEKYHESTDGVTDHAFYGALPKRLIIEQNMVVRRMTLNHYKVKQVCTYDYSDGKLLHRLDDESGVIVCGMYYNIASAKYYCDLETGKAFVTIVLGPKYSINYNYDISISGNVVTLENETIRGGA